MYSMRIDETLLNQYKQKCDDSNISQNELLEICMQAFIDNLLVIEDKTILKPVQSKQVIIKKVN